MSSKTQTLKVMALSAVLTAGLTGCNNTAAPVDDATLTAQVQQKIAADAAVSGEPVQVVAQGGVVTLTGNVSNGAVRTLVARDAAGVAGVKQVTNDITVAPAAPANMAAVAPAPQPAPAPVPAPRVKVAPPPPPVRTPAPITRAVNEPPPPPAPVRPVPPPPPAPPAARLVTLPAGSTLPVRITQTLDSATTQTGDSFTGAIATDIVQDGMVMLPRGANVTGHVIEVKEAAHFKGASLLSVELTGIDARGQRISVSTQPYNVEGKGRGSNTAIKTGVGAAAGAVLGGIFGGGKGAAIGAAAGGGTGAGINAVTRGQQVQIPSESVVRFVTNNSIAVKTSVHAGGNPDDAGLQNRY